MYSEIMEHKEQGKICFEFALFTDRFNTKKSWYVKRSKCGHFYLAQKMQWEPKRGPWSRVGKKHVSQIMNTLSI